MSKIFAADFGADNTCLYWINLDAAFPVCTALNAPFGEPSGYAIQKNGKVLLGLELYGLHYDDLENIREFHINLKGVPSEENRKELTDYFKLWCEKLMKDKQEEFIGLDESYWFIGCPTGAEWKSKEVRKLYKKIFEDAGFKNVYIVPESNGALAYFEKTNNVLKECGTDKKLFLIDLGAYSIDATPYFGGALGTSYGKYLGASLIDRMILRTILYGEEEKFRKGKKIINMSQTLQTARTHYKSSEDHEKFSSYMLLQARKLKEDYFTKERENKLPPKGNLKFPSGFYVGEEEFTLFVNPDMMDTLLEKTPIREVLGEEFYTLKKEVIDYVGNLTWMDTLRKFLCELGKEYKVADKGADAVIMLTGGGSLMKCVADEVKKFFSEAAIHYDPEAISAIGQGIAYWSPDKIRAINFQKQFQKFVEYESKNVITPKLAEAFNNCVSDISRAITAEECDAVVFGIEQWKTYNCLSSEIPGKMESHFKNWLDNTGIPIFNANFEQCTNDLRETINEDFRENFFNITLLSKFEPIFLSESKKKFKFSFEFFTQKIVDHYKENEIWDLFPNPTDGLFPDPCKRWYNDCAKALNQWLQEQIDLTIKLCENFFTEWKVPTEQFEDITLQEFFISEAPCELKNLMEERGAELAKKMVLEELFNEE